MTRQIAVVFLATIVAALVASACVSADDARQELVERLYERGFNQGDTTVVDEVLGAGFQNHSQSARLPWAGGRDVYREEIRTFREAFPDLHLQVDDWIVQADKVVARVTWTGTHLGDLPDAPASGRQFQSTGVYIYRVDGGKIVEAWSEFDRAGFLRQLGIEPAA